MLTLLAAPAAYPVSLSEAKDQLHVLHDDDDALIQGYIAAAAKRLDGFDGILCRSLVTQSWRLTASCFPSELPLRPVLSVDQIQYVDENDATQSFADYILVGDKLHAQDKWPTTIRRADAVTIDFTSGYGGPSDVPEDLRLAIMMLVRHFYDSRGDLNSALPKEVYALAAPYRAVTM